jgi:hypothetical protein
MSPRKSCWSFALVLGLCSLLGGNAKAGVLKFESEVTVLAGATVGSGIFLSDAAVKFTGLFDTADTVDGGIYGYTPFLSLQIEIDTLGTFDAAAPGSFGVLSINPLLFGGPAIGLSDALVATGYFGIFGSTTQPYAYNALSPNEFTNLADVDASDFPVVIALAGGAGDFTFNVSETNPVTASISAVPEPTSMAIFGLGSLLVVARRVRRARSAA